MSWAALLLLVLCLAAAGLGVLCRLRVPVSLSLALATGAVALHVVLQIETLAGVRWSFLESWALGVLGVVALWRARRPPRVAPGSWTGGWGDGVALVSLIALALLCARAAIDNPDFVYHWGAKGRKFAAAAGIDLAFLGPPSGWHLHPDYPNLLPELFAFTARLGGGWVDGTALLWTAVAGAALILAAREALAPVDRALRQVVVAGLCAALLAAAFALELAGNADLLVSWALVLAVPALLVPRSAGATARVGIAAALAASSKIEGVPLAAFMILAFLVARRAAPGPPAVGRERWTRLAFVLLPTILVVAPWLWINLRHGLFLPGNTGQLSLSRLALAVPEALAVLWSPAWSGLPLTLVALPWLCIARRTRWAAWVSVAQLGFYFWIYGSATADSARYVQWSFARLLLHVLPAVWVLCALCWTPAAEAGESDEEARGLRPGSKIDDVR